jgi:hypothetical protein
MVQMELSEALDLIQALGLGSVLTAAIYGLGRWALEWQRGRNRVAEIKALRDAQLALDRQHEKQPRRQLDRPRPPPPR